MSKKRQNIINELPSDPDALREELGWNDASMVALFERFVEENKLQEKWGQFLTERAADELEGL